MCLYLQCTKVCACSLYTHIHRLRYDRQIRHEQRLRPEKGTLLGRKRFSFTFIPPSIPPKFRFIVQKVRILEWYPHNDHYCQTIIILSTSDFFFRTQTYSKINAHRTVQIVDYRSEYCFFSFPNRYHCDDCKIFVDVCARTGSKPIIEIYLFRFTIYLYAYERNYALNPRG